MSTKMTSTEMCSNIEKLFSSISLRSNFVLIIVSWAEARKLLIDRDHSDRGEIKPLRLKKKKEVNSYAPVPQESRPEQEILCWTITDRGAQSGMYFTSALN